MQGLSITINKENEGETFSFHARFDKPRSGLFRRLWVFLQGGYACPLGFSNLFEEEGNKL